MASEQSRSPTERDCYATTDAALCDALNEDLRETISELAEARGQTSAGVIKAAVVQIVEKDEDRIIDFEFPDEARSYYRRHKQIAQEFDGAYDDLTPDEPYGTPAQPLHELLQRKRAEHESKANVAARWLDKNDPDTKVILNEYGSPEAIPQLDKLIEVQHGE